MRYRVKDYDKRRAVKVLFGFDEFESYRPLVRNEIHIQANLPSFNPYSGFVAGAAFEVEPVAGGNDDRQLELPLDDEVL